LGTNMFPPQCFTPKYAINRALASEALFDQ
jgi:hypothetical protein